MKSRIPKQKDVELMKLVPGIKHPGGKGSNYDGEPTIIPLRRFENDRALRAEPLIGECCDCGLKHLHLFEVFFAASQWYVAKRSYRLDPQDFTRRPSAARKKRGPGKKG